MASFITTAPIDAINTYVHRKWIFLATVCTGQCPAPYAATLLERLELSAKLLEVRAQSDAEFRSAADDVRHIADAAAAVVAARTS